MKSLQFFIDQTHKLLNELIQVATQLRDMSKQVISEENLSLLQKKQDDLLGQIERIDQQMQRDYPQQVSSKMEEQLHEKLQTFQQINQEFIQNLGASHGLIQFELCRLGKEQEGEDFAQLKRLNKIFPSPNSSKTIEPEENKES
jgi:hypothetical protein